MKTVSSKALVHYHDCDPMGHLNNARYIDYMMSARTEQLRDHYQLNIAQMAAKQGIGWATAQTFLSYFSPAFWMETVEIETCLIRFSDSSILFEAIMWDEQKQKPKALMWCKLVHFDIRTQKSMKHSQELMQLFANAENPELAKLSFEERSLQLRQNPKNTQA